MNLVPLSHSDVSSLFMNKMSWPNGNTSVKKLRERGRQRRDNETKGSDSKVKFNGEKQEDMKEVYKVTKQNEYTMNQKRSREKKNQNKWLLTGESTLTPQAIKEDVWEILKCNGGGCQRSTACQSSY